MTDSSERKSLAEKRERNREQRLEQIKRWAEYIDSNPPETWGPQLNGLINSQLASARNTDISTEQRRRIERISEPRNK
ncbi:hypothetical protein [Haloarcula onubensis]|uniref:Uncharacterized protein n=1 Tax=Haloarcula onubensis TaxID=2950539 RepID=A0ABU2FPR1_9EURY|nr:hypothetical protein [Halomicroarcula sp. S3CR25-11]MDS0282266.1 hypothetical protein [Halomicroarcula sp. S3CR25-11]